MIRLVFILFFISPLLLASQEMDRLGLDNSSVLNEDESVFLNKLLVQQGDRFDFTNAKIAFVTGSAGTKIVDKQYYFDKLILPFIEKDVEPSTFYKQLDDEEKHISGGYDAIVFAWVKWYTDGKKDNLVKKLGRKGEY